MRMRGAEDPQKAAFSYVALEQRVPPKHPLRAVRNLVGAVLQSMNVSLAGMYLHTGRPSIPPERLIRALLLQLFYSIRSERLLMEQIDYNLLFRWFVGLEVDDQVELELATHRRPQPRAASLQRPQTPFRTRLQIASHTIAIQ